MQTRPLRSVLYMPASNARALEKARNLDVDAVIFDLEDAVSPDAKPEARLQAVRAVSEGGYGRRVKEPSGHCFRVMHCPGGPVSFAGTMGRSRCFNYEAKPPPATDVRGRGFVTIWGPGDKILWQGREGEEPAEFRQGELGL